MSEGGRDERGFDASRRAEIIVAARSRRPPLILSDIMMPVLRGVELVAALRAEPDLEAASVILLSESAGLEARTEGVGAGAGDYSSEPLGPAELQARFENHLELARARQEREERLRGSIREHELTQVALREEVQRLETLNALGRSLVAELDLRQLYQTMTDAATEQSGAAFGAFFQNVDDGDGGASMVYTLSGAPQEAFEEYGVLRKTALFVPTFDGEGPVRIDDVLQDPRYGTHEPRCGMPEGLSVRSYMAVPVVASDSSVIGGLFFGHPEPGVFTDKAERVVLGLASQAAVAIENTRLHEEREQLIEQLREADRRKDDFLAMLGHELRNPLAAIRGATDLIGILVPDHEPISPAHEVLDRQTVHVSRLIDGLLEISRISLGKISLETRTVDLRPIVRSVVADHRDGADGKGIRLTHDLSGKPLWISGDPVRLTQIFDNLVSNAIKFSEPGGSVSVVLEPDGECALARILDDGVGIRPEQLVHIFEPFHQEVQELIRTRGGLGLGLALVRSLVEMHRGSVEACSDGPGRGAEFRVVFPRTEPKGDGGELQSTTEIRPLRILLVEDNRDLVETLQLLLQADGHEARTARSGSEALEILDSCDPDVVLCDLGLPGMSGYDVARSVRETGSSVPMVALTGYGQPDDRVKTSEAGFDHHLVKPVDVARLRKVWELLDLPRGPRLAADRPAGVSSEAQAR